MGLMSVQPNNPNTTYSSVADQQKQFKFSAFNETQELKFEEEG